VERKSGRVGKDSIGALVNASVEAGWDGSADTGSVRHDVSVITTESNNAYVKWILRTQIWNRVCQKPLILAAPGHGPDTKTIEELIQPNKLSRQWIAWERVSNLKLNEFLLITNVLPPQLGMYLTPTVLLGSNRISTENPQRARTLLKRLYQKSALKMHCTRVYFTLLGNACKGLAKQLAEVSNDTYLSV
jgi:hypothetical protein